jgi:hypothetical protein
VTNDFTDDSFSKHWRQARRILEGTGVAHVTVVYSGHNGVDGVVLIHLYDTNGKPLPDNTVPGDVFKEFLTLFADLLQQRYPEWHQGNGSFGVIEWSVRSDRLRHLHHQRSVEVKSSLREGL